jgi:hypothetical protein
MTDYDDDFIDQMLQQKYAGADVPGEDELIQAALCMRFAGVEQHSAPLTPSTPTAALLMQLLSNLETTHGDAATAGEAELVSMLREVIAAGEDEQEIAANVQGVISKMMASEGLLLESPGQDHAAGDMPDDAAWAAWEDADAVAGGSYAAAAEMATDGTADENYPLHRAVWANESHVVAQLLAGGADTEERDLHGATALLLALRLPGRHACAHALLDSGAKCDLKSGENFHLMDECVELGDELLVSRVYQHLHRETFAAWVERRPLLLQSLEACPDFSLEMKWKLKSGGLLKPFIKAFAPHDTYKITKRGSMVRVDSTIVGFSKMMKAKRGSISLLMCSDREPPNDIWLVDRKQKTAKPLLNPELTTEQLSSAVARLMQVGEQPTESMDVSVQPGESSFAPKTPAKTAKVQSWDAKLYVAKTCVHVKKLKKTRDLEARGEANYFQPGMRRTEYTTKRMRKDLEAEVWMSEHFPLALTEVSERAATRCAPAHFPLSHARTPSRCSSCPH